MSDPTPKHGAIVWTDYGAAAWAQKERIKPRQWGARSTRSGAAPGFRSRPRSLSPSSASLAKFHHRSVLRTPLLLPTPTSLASPKNEINKSLLEGAPLRKLTFDLPGFALFPSGHAARLPLLPCSRYRSGAGRGRGWREGDRSTDGIHWEAGGRLEMQSKMTENKEKGKSVCARDGGRGEEKRRSGWVRQKARMRGERSRKSGGREQGKERGREGERRKEEREGGREGGESLAPRSLSPSPARSLPLPRRLRCPRRAPLRLTGGRRCRRGRGRGRGFPGRGGGKRGAFVRQAWRAVATTSDKSACKSPAASGARAVEAGGFNRPGAARASGGGESRNFPERGAAGERAKKLGGSRQAARVSRPAQGSPGCPGTAGVPRSRPEPQVPAAACPRQERPFPPRWPRAGRSQGCEPRAGFAPPSARRVPLRSQVPGRCLRRRADGRTDGRTDGRAAGVLPLRSSGRLRSAAVAWGVLAVRPSLFAPPRPRVLGFWLVGERGRQAGRPAFLNSDSNSERFFLHGRSQHLTLLLLTPVQYLDKAKQCSCLQSVSLDKNSLERSWIISFAYIVVSDPLWADHGLCVWVYCQALHAHYHLLSVAKHKLFKNSGKKTIHTNKKESVWIHECQGRTYYTEMSLLLCFQKFQIWHISVIQL